jgi:CubicO group peptidase (beta-lactamase class C family)
VRAGPLRRLALSTAALAIVGIGLIQATDQALRIPAGERLVVRDLAAAPPESVGVSAERLARLDAGMRQMVDSGRVAGVVTLLTRRGKTVSQTAYGRKDIRRADPLAKDSIFRIYSMTKPVTGVAMMMLYEEGKWRLDDPVSRYIPEFATLKVHTGESNADGTPKLEDARRPMTMRELMTHTAGFGYGLLAAHPVDRMYRETRVLNSAVPLQQMIDGLARLPLLAQPGTRWSYSIAVDVQGYLVEKLSGMSFDRFLQTRIFGPLDMKDTGFFVPRDQVGRLALVHGEDGSGRLTPPRDSGDDPTVAPIGPSGGAGLFSTAADYARFCEMLLGGGRLGQARLLAPRTVEMLRTNHVLPQPLETMRPGLGWGMDVQVVMDAAAAGEPYSDGAFHWWGIAGTWFWIDPVEDFAFVGMVQHQGPTFRTVNELHGLSRNWVYQAIVD